MKRLLSLILTTLIISCSQGEKIPQKLRVDIDKDFFKNNYKGQIDGERCFIYKLKDRELYLIPNSKKVGIIEIQDYPRLDSLALSYTGAKTNSGPIYQVDELIYASPDSTSKK